MIVLAAPQSRTVALCAPEIIETYEEMPENIHGTHGDILILANKYFFKSSRDVTNRVQTRLLHLCLNQQLNYVRAQYPCVNISHGLSNSSCSPWIFSF